VNCVKCGAELHPDQKVCIKCGTRTAAGGHFYIEKKEAWKPTRNMKYAAAGAVVLLIVALIVNSLKVIPPDEVTKEWFDAMVGREYNKAARHHSPEFTSKMQSGISDTRAISDYLYDDVVNNQAQYTIGAPTYDIPAAPTRANVMVTLTLADGRQNEIQVDLIKSGRRWLIDNVAY